MVMLYDHLNRPIRTQELKREQSAPTLTGIRTIWNDSFASGLTPVGLAGLLRSAADGDHHAYLTLAEEMEERDLHYAGELGKRKLAVSRLPITVESATDSARDKEIAEAVRGMMKKAGIRALLKDLLDAIGKGYSAIEIIWKTGSRWMPERYEWRDPRFFQFDQESRRKIRLRDESDLMNGIDLTPFKYLVHIHHGKSGIPIRGGIARLAAWSYMCKAYTIKDWLAFAEVFGMPLRMGKYGPSARPDEINILKAAVANLGIDAAAVFPESMQIELVEVAGKGGSSDFFKVLANYLDDQVSKGILGQTASASGTPGKLGNDNLQAEVRDDIRDDDAEAIEETLNRDLVRSFVDLNYGPQENYPDVQIRATKKEDIAVLVSAVKDLVPLGLLVEQSVMRDKLGLPDPDPQAKPEDLLHAPAQQPVAQGSALQRALNAADPPAGSVEEALYTWMKNASADPAAAMLDAAETLLAEVGSLEEFRERLIDLFAATDPEMLAESMARLDMLANLSGRLEVMEE